MKERLKKQIEFIIEIDKVKSIFRRSKLFDGTRFENDAEHAWHIAMMAIILSEYSNEPSVDVTKILKMLLIHDIVEIDAGDIPVYDTKRRIENKDNEKKAAKRIFGLLPDDQRTEMIALWEEFEKRESREAKFAAALDRIEPVMQNYYTHGYTWNQLEVTYEKVISTNNKNIMEGSQQLWDYIEGSINESVEKGYLKNEIKT